MEDFPRTLAELEERFATEEACREYLYQLRWPNGFCCPRCQRQKAWRNGRVYECAGCGYQLSVTAGTIFHRSRLPLPTWFRAIWWVVSQKNGASALGLKRILGLGSYQTAWSWLHKLRRAMIRPERERLSGQVEVDEAYVGGEETGVRGRETEKKAIVAIAVEVHEPRGFGRIRLRRVPDVSGRSLVSFVCDTIEPGSEVRTDGWSGYSALPENGYRRNKIVLSSSGDPAHVSLPGVHRVAALLKRWLLGTHQGAVHPAHLDYYLDEFTFRFNRRTSRSRGKLFYRLLQNAVLREPISYRQIVKQVRGPAPKPHPNR